jgi:Tfp pilus assembly protein PilV
MDVVTVIVVVLVLVVGLLALGGYIANRRRFDAEAGEIEQAARMADQHLARAHAADKGWDRALLEEAARVAYTERTGRAPAALTLVQVVDRPGIEEDEAVFDADGERLALGRSEAGWRPVV